MATRLDASNHSLRRILKSSRNGIKPKNQVVPQRTDKMDLSHQNLEGLSRSELISVLEAHNLTPEKIIFVLAAFKML